MSFRSQVVPVVLIAGLAVAVVGTAAARSPHGGFGGPHAAKFDRDGDGKVQLADVASDAARRAAEIDADGDGTITATELRAHENRQREALAQKRLARLDANGDGIVSTEEFASQQTERVAKLDADGDGVVSREEFRAARPHRRGPRPEQDAAE